MPFDGTPAPRDAAALLAALEALLDDGRCWTRGDFADGQGRFCLRGGLDHLRGHCGAGDGQAELFLRAAITEHHGWEMPTVQANDSAEEFDLIRWFIARARQLALMASGLPAPPVAPVAEHLLPPKADPGVLFKHLMKDCRLKPARVRCDGGRSFPPASAPQRWRAILRAVGRQEVESVMRQGDEAPRMLWALLRPSFGLQPSTEAQQGEDDDGTRSVCQHSRRNHGGATPGDGCAACTLSRAQPAA